MSKMIYLIKRICGMDYKNMLFVITRLHAKTGKSYLFLIYDIIKCAIRYQAGYMDYELFAMYELSNQQRETILTRGKNNDFIRKYNQKEYRSFFFDKGKFNKRFSSYLKRDWIILNDNYAEFKHFLYGKKEIIAKPIIGTCGKGIEKIAVEKNHRRLYSKLMKKDLLLVEEVIKQHKTMNMLYDGAINTIRFVSLYKNSKTHFICAYLRIGNGSVVDNFNHGGMVVPIDIQTGKIECMAVDKNGALYEKHPLTGMDIVGFQIPKWQEILKLVKEVAPIVPEIGLVGWDIAVTPIGPILVEGNEFPGHDIYQLPPHRNNGIGLYPVFQNIEKEQ